ncbi:hypothetical protein ROE7235_03750 [Roseibaca ekhonensis]|uniref:Uncharacterized protein n=1 Tax=Roseinatronobacter ekhonensis TaxID=254356 RepID=A0A3B0MW21_9RHOB|nr:hypothetical protein [Roseibaca ekhonensis]SUZ33969.1 hypothetical protein ROE7235_03750 [Roseibaca ekhonensis]
MPKLDLTTARRVMTGAGEARAIKAGAGLWRARKPLLDDPGVIELHGFDPLWTHPDLAGAGIGQADAHVARITDLGSGGFHATQAVTAHQPVLRRAGNLWWQEFDGVSDRVIVPPGGWQGADMSLVMVARLQSAATDDARVLAGGVDGLYIALYQSGSSETTIGAGNARYVNGSLIPAPTRGDLYNAWVTEDWVVLEVAGVDFTDSNFNNGLQYPGWRGGLNLVDGEIAFVAVMPTALANTVRASLTTTLASIFGISL